MAKQDPYAKVTDSIIEALEAGTVPWSRPWRSAMPRSMATGKHYRGVNVITLGMLSDHASPWWGTYRQIGERGGQVRKGERASVAVYWKIIRKRDAETGEEKTIPLLRTFSLFNLDQADWPDGIPSAFVPEVVEVVEPSTAAEAILADYYDAGPGIDHVGEAAHYSPRRDVVTIPPRDLFRSTDAYYRTLFHETVHSTGHPSRLARPGIVDLDGFGSHQYSREELIAEVGAAMLAAETGIETSEGLDQSAAYIDSWLRVLRGDSKLIVAAASEAAKAVDAIRGEALDLDVETSDQ